MATQTGECQIDSIEGHIVRGWFKSVYENNVHEAHPVTAAMILKDAWSSLAGRNVDEAALKAAIHAVHFATPNQTSTQFTIEVSDAKLLDGLPTGYWESYYVG